MGRSGTHFSFGAYGAEIPLLSALFATGVTSTTYSQTVKLPTGSGAVVTRVMVSAGAVTSDPSLTIGTTTAATALVAAVNVTTGLGLCTVKTPTGLLPGEVGESGSVKVLVTNDANDAFTALRVTLYGYFTDYDGPVGNRVKVR